jgi:hypothetical protein
MPLLDVTEILDDDDFSDTFSVIRRTESVNSSTGRSAVTTVQTDNLVGVLTFEGGDLDRQDTAQMTTRLLNIITTFRLRGSNTANQPDIVIYDGVQFTVKSVEGWHKFGDGFVSATAESMNASDPPFA